MPKLKSFECVRINFIVHYVLLVCFTLLLLVFGVQITIGTFASSIRNEVVEFIRPRLLAFLKEPKNDSKFDAIQSTLNCCGVYEPGDWRTFGNHTNDSVLDSCCDVSGCRTDRPNCLAESLRFGDNVFLITCSICFSFGVLQLFVMASTMVMICWIRKYDKIDGTEA
ncbi:hypothetical protein SNE40_001930 [Patella caerulea]|uniref:Tetraspanin n=1 Tax=Patella caerulea TaxID=87958 RepID=A0AAN8K7K0_PATCE